MRATVHRLLVTLRECNRSSLDSHFRTATSYQSRQNHHVTEPPHRSMRFTGAQPKSGRVPTSYCPGQRSSSFARLLLRHCTDMARYRHVSRRKILPLCAVERCLSWGEYYSRHGRSHHCHFRQAVIDGQSSLVTVVTLRACNRSSFASHASCVQSFIVC